MIEDWPPGLYTYVSLLVFLFGSALGSFLNVCVYRIPREQSVITPRSRCPHCETPIAWYDNLPILSYLFLRGQCRRCHTTISPRYIIIEALTGVLFLALWLIHGWSAVTPLYMLAVFGLLLATFVDLEHMIIPDRVSIGGMLLGLMLSAAFPVLHQALTPLESVVSSIIGLVAGAGSLWLVSVLGKWAFKKDAMGLGDVKLLGAIGAFMGWEGVLFTIMLSSLGGSAVGLAFILTGRQDWQSRIPYGPYIALGAIIWMLWGMGWWEAYVEWMAIV